MQEIDSFVVAVNKFYYDYNNTFKSCINQILSYETEYKKVQKSKIPIIGQICRPLYSDAIDKAKILCSTILCGI